MVHDAGNAPYSILRSIANVLSNIVPATFSRCHLHGPNTIAFCLLAQSEWPRECAAAS